MSAALGVRNGESVGIEKVPLLPVPAFQEALCAGLAEGGRLCALFGRESAGRGVLVTGVVARDAESRLDLLSTEVGGSWPSISAEWPAAQLFERELWEQYGVVPEGHPWLKRVRFEHPLPGALASAPGAPADGIPGDDPFFRMEGAELHEVAVGPVHAGVIEPGHFRFSCHGEHVFHLEIVLGYQHRGVERSLLGGPHLRTPSVMESIAGDTAIGHGLAFCRAMEALAGEEAPPRAEALRAVALELERLANHVGDLGMLAGDVGFLPTASACGALRARFLNASAELCGNRLGKGLLVPGGVRFDLSPADAGRLAGVVEESMTAVRGPVQLFFRSPSARNRTDGTGAISPESCRELGLVGPAARACGVGRDVRRDHPAPGESPAHAKVALGEAGDVHARAWVRFLEAERSAELASSLLRRLPDGPVRATLPPLRPGRLAVSLVEGWRGEIAHVAVTDGEGRFARYKVKDPSFHNWMGLALALRGEAISDFPLCNKSFNLSYAGHDL